MTRCPEAWSFIACAYDMTRCPEAWSFSSYKIQAAPLLSSARATSWTTTPLPLKLCAHMVLRRRMDFPSAGSFPLRLAGFAREERPPVLLPRHGGAFCLSQPTPQAARTCSSTRAPSRATTPSRLITLYVMRPARHHDGFACAIACASVS